MNDGQATVGERRVHTQGAERGLFYRPDAKKRYVISLDHRQKSGRFEIYTDEGVMFNFRLQAKNRKTLLSRGPYETRDDSLEAVARPRDAFIGADAVEAS